MADDGEDRTWPQDAQRTRSSARGTTAPWSRDSRSSWVSLPNPTQCSAPAASVRELRALPLGAALALLEACLEAAAGVLLVALLLVGRAQDEPRLGVAGVEGHGLLAGLDRVGDLAALEGELRRVLGLRRLLGIGLGRDVAHGRGRVGRRGGGGVGWRRRGSRCRSSRL